MSQSHLRPTTMRRLVLDKILNFSVSSRAYVLGLSQGSETRVHTKKKNPVGFLGLGVPT